MNLQGELLDKLAALEAVETDKKEAMKSYSDDIKHLRKEVKRLRVELEVTRSYGEEGA